MEKYILTLYVSLEQELAIRELFIYHNWSFTKQDDEVETKTAAVMTERSDSLDMSDLDWTEVTTMPSVGNQASEDSSNIMLLGPSRVETNGRQESLDSSTETNGNQELQSTGIVISENQEMQGTGIVTNGSQDLMDASTETDGMISLTEQLLDSLKSATENNLIHKSKKDEISCSNVKKNSAENKVNVKKRPPKKRVTVASLISSEKNSTDMLNSQNDDMKTETGNLEFDHSNIEDSTASLLAFGKTCTNIFNSQEDNFKTETLEFDHSNIEDSPIKKEDFHDENPKAKTREKLRKYHCEECNYTFKLKGAFLNHKKNGQCLFECKFCGKKYTARFYSNYKSHLKYHIKERPHRCNICGKTYIEEQTLKVHLRRHSGDRPYICDICGKRFYCSANLLGHKHNMHSESREMFQCDLCGAVLSNKGNLQAHKKLVHTLECAFTCEICGKSFKTQKRLEQVHAKVHTEVFPFKCDVAGCGKAFKRMEALTDHIRRHNNDRSHFCEVCHKGFYCSKDLKLHHRVHTGEKPFSCDLCSYKSTLAGNLRKHMKIHENS